MTAPTRLIGMVDDRQFGTLVSDIYETIPDLFYPMSVDIYGQMRRDAQLAAIIDGYSLQLRRAQWQLDGAGCRPEVTQFVADCLGLNVAGYDEATGARRRGVSWGDHLRSSLLSLVWGHYAFEMQAEVADGLARLVTLAERMPATIAAIRADPRTGALLGIDQSQVTGPDKSPQIPADRLVFYSRNREGAAWQGNSLIRPAYSSWLIKREMIRVNAISNRRWGAGVPVAKAQAGTSPTPGQMQEAQRMASAARAGDQAGAAMPPGFDLQILGLSGAVPDTLGFVQFLNNEMARSVLMQHIDLGSTATGSRALGASFIDSWTLALEAEAEFIADVATRQACTRIVDWNWGEDEPVPRVVASGIGSRREVTAESLQLLLNSGALSVDPGLEAWVRREYRLPEREEGPTPTPARRTPRAPAQPDDAEAALDAEPVVASRRPTSRRSKAVDGQLALPILAAAPSPEAAGVDPAAIQRAWRQELDALARQWPAAADPMVGEVVAAVVAAVAAGTLPELVASAGIVVSAKALAAMAKPLTASLLKLAKLSARQVVDEVKAQGVRLKVPAVDAEDLTARAQAAARVIATGYINGAQQVALSLATPDVDADAVGGRVREHLDGISQTAAGGEQPGRGWVIGNLGQLLSQAQGAGRLATFQALEAAGHAPAYIASEEEEDGNRCKPCSDINGHRFKTLPEATAAYPNGQYIACLGRGRCRGHLYVLLGD